MAFSKWYADVILPGSNATTVTSNWGDFSSEFPWGDEPILDKVSYYNSCDSSDNILNPLSGKTKNIVVNGAPQFVYHSRYRSNLFSATNSFQMSSASSTSFSSSSSRSSSSSHPSSSSSSRSGLSSSSSSFSHISSSSSSLSFSSASSSSSSHSFSCSSSSSSSSSPTYKWVGTICANPSPDTYYADVNYYTTGEAVLMAGLASEDWTYVGSEDSGPYIRQPSGDCSPPITYKGRYGACLSFEKTYDGEESMSVPFSLLSLADVHVVAVLNPDKSYPAEPVPDWYPETGIGFPGPLPPLETYPYFDLYLIGGSPYGPYGGAWDYLGCCFEKFICYYGNDLSSPGIMPGPIPWGDLVNVCCYDNTPFRMKSVANQTKLIEKSKEYVNNTAEEKEIENLKHNKIVHVVNLSEIGNTQKLVIESMNKNKNIFVNQIVLTNESIDVGECLNKQSVGYYIKDILSVASLESQEEDFWIVFTDEFCTMSSDFYQDILDETESNVIELHCLDVLNNPKTLLELKTFPSEFVENEANGIAIRSSYYNEVKNMIPDLFVNEKLWDICLFGILRSFTNVKVEMSALYRSKS